MGSVATQAPVDVHSADRGEPGSFHLHTANLPVTSSSKPEDVDSIAQTWVDSMNEILKNPGLATEIFFEDSYWRDQLCLFWDFHTLKGPEKIVSLLKQSKNDCLIKSFTLDKSSKLRSPTYSVMDADSKVHTVQAFLNLETEVRRSSGIVRLVQHPGPWKVFTLYTFLKELKNHEEVVGKRRPNGVAHGEHLSRKNWLDRRKAEENFEDDEEPAVLILGAWQAGLCTAARLKILGIKSLIVDREERIGDNWRSRYHQLVLHDPVWFDHLPYLPSPENWPIFTPKDKLGDWFESYVKLLELNAWTSTNITQSSWDADAGHWKVTLDCFYDGKQETRVFHPSGEPNFPSHLKGLSTFTGTRLVHSSKFTGTLPSQGQNRRAIVVGCCNSGHDIAQDFYENGYSVTLIQSSITFVISAETSLHHTSALYGEDGPPTEDADLLFFSIPNAVAKRLNVDTTKVQNKSDEKLLLGLEQAGFKTDKGPDESGLCIKYLTRGGGYYLDVGCSQLIADGKIKVKQGCEITEVLPKGLLFSDGDILEADEIVFATGYLNMRTQCRKIFVDEVADQVKDVWGFDEEGEIRTMWRKTGHPGFWFMGGNLALCRWYSRLLALQIKGLEEGLCSYDDF